MNICCLVWWKITKVSLGLLLIDVVTLTGLISLDVSSDVCLLGLRIGLGR